MKGAILNIAGVPARAGTLHSDFGCRQASPRDSPNVLERRYTAGAGKNVLDERVHRGMSGC